MSVSITYRNLTIVILAGGQSTRMGIDKGLLAFRNGNFSEQLITLATSLTSNVIVSVGKHNQEVYKNKGAITVLDEVDAKGPMGGIASVISNIETNWFFVISVDTPLVTEEMIAELWNNKTGFDSVVYSTDNRIHPLVGLYNRSTKPLWENAFEFNKLKVTALVNQFKLKVIEANSEIKENLKNINTPKEYEELITIK